MEWVNKLLDVDFILGAIAAFLLLLVWRHWARVKEKLSYSWLNFSMYCPITGFIARSARESHALEVDPDTGTAWYSSEQDLCARYYHLYDKLSDKDESFFEQCTDYLIKVTERGRKPLLMWLVLLALFMLAEAYITALVLATNIAPNFSAEQQEGAAIGIALLLTGVLFVAALWVGHRLHRASLINKAHSLYYAAKREWDRNKASAKIKALQSGHNEAKTLPEFKALRADRENIELAHSKQDNDSAKYQQILNRVELEDSDVQRKSKVRIWAWYGALIGVCVAIFFIIRMLSLSELDPIQTSTTPFSQMENGSFSPGANSGFMPPPEIEPNNQLVDQGFDSDRWADKLEGHRWGFVFLGLMFVLIQVLSAAVHEMGAYAGTHSKKAARYIEGFNNGKEFSRWCERFQDQTACKKILRVNTRWTAASRNPARAAPSPSTCANGSRCAGQEEPTGPVIRQPKRCRTRCRPIPMNQSPQ